MNPLGVKKCLLTSRKPVWCFMLGLLAASLGRSAIGADLTIGGATGARRIVVPDAQWMDEAAWTNLPDRSISSWYPKRQNMTYFAARLLQEYFRKITDAELTIVSETEWERDDCPEAAIIGPTRFACRQFGARLTPENRRRGGYVAKSLPGRLLICGVTPWATYGGCAAVLEEYAGVEWFWPTELGEEVPRKAQLSFDRVDSAFDPAIAFHSGMLGEWGARVGERPYELESGHSLGPNIYHDGRDTNPEWFPLLDGKRFIPGPSARDAVSYWQPCMASPAALERAVAVVKQAFRDNPEQRSFSLAANDGVWRGCECEYCKAADGDPDPAFATVPYHYNGRYSRRYYSFIEHIARAVAEAYPGRLVTMFPYAGMDIPPADARPIPNLAFTLPSTKLAWLDPELRKWEELRHKLWARLAAYPGSYDYMYQTGYLPMYAPHLYADVTRFLWTNGYVHAYAETYQTMGRSGPKYWAHIKLCNNPTLSVDALLDKWMRGMFKEAAAPMADFYAAIEQAWTNYPYHARNADGWSTYCYVDGADLPLFTPDCLARLDASLVQAEKIARDAKVKARLAVVRKNYLPTRAMADLMWRCRPYKDPVPFDDAIVLAELKDHEQQVPPFDFPGYYETVCANDPLSSMGRARIMPPENTAAQRLGRVADGLAAPALMATNGTPGIEARRAAVVRRTEDLTAKAAASATTRKLLLDLSARCVNVGKVAAAPRLDGVLDDACWQAAAPHEGFLVGPSDPIPPPAGKPSPPPAGIVPPCSNAIAQTTFRICHDGRYLYLAARCRQGNLSGNDRIEVSLAPWQASHSGRALGATITLKADGAVIETSQGFGSTYWHARTRSAVKIENGGYLLEAAIPFMAFSFSPLNGSLCRFNIERHATGGSAPEQSAWYPTALGMTWARFDDADARDLVQSFAAATTVAINSGIVESNMNPKDWDAYSLAEPTGVKRSGKKGAGAQTGGGQATLIAKAYTPIQPGHKYDLEVESSGHGTCAPSLDWYARTSDGYVEVFNVDRNGLPLKASNESPGRATVTAPLKADAARFRVTCSGEAQVARCRLTPRLPLAVRVDLDTDADRLITGHVLGLQATVRNLTDKPIHGLRARLAFPAGVDRCGEAVAVADKLAPGATTQALWWLTPIYAVGQADFNIVTEADGVPAIVTSVRGPISKPN